MKYQWKLSKMKHRKNYLKNKSFSCGTMSSTHIHMWLEYSKEQTKWPKLFHIWWNYKLMDPRNSMNAKHRKKKTGGNIPLKSIVIKFLKTGDKMRRIKATMKKKTHYNKIKMIDTLSNIIQLRKWWITKKEERKW